MPRCVRYSNYARAGQRRPLAFAPFPGPGTDPVNLAWNRNKRSLALDLKAPDTRDVVHRLVAQADVLVQNFRPGVMRKLGFGYDEMRAVNPRLIYCSGSGYGEDGPYVARPGQDMLIQGLTGLAAATGRADGPPVPTGAGFADQVGAMNMVYAVLAALYWRERSGEGQEVRIDLTSGLLAHQGQEMLAAMHFGRDFLRPNSGIGHPGMDAPFGVYPTRDGWVTIAMSPFRTLVDVLGAPSLLQFDTPPAITRPPPTVGQHSRAILEEFGFTEAEADGLVGSGAVAQG